MNKMKSFYVYLVLVVALSWSTVVGYGQQTNSTNVPNKSEQFILSTHILDISKGSPASGVEVELFLQQGDIEVWKSVAKQKTNLQGRIGDFLPKASFKTGIYKLRFYTKPYFVGQKLQSIYPFIEVVFELNDDTHYHIPITVSPYGYSTYRGS